MQSISIVTPSDDYRSRGPDAESIEDTARALGVGRSFVYRAIHPDPAVRDGLPFLPSIKAGKRRLVRIEARRAWLAELEERCVADAQTGAAP